MQVFVELTSHVGRSPQGSLVVWNEKVQVWQVEALSLSVQQELKEEECPD